MCGDCTPDTPHSPRPSLSRRHLILGGLAAAGAMAATPRPALASPPRPMADAARSLGFQNLHTGEALHATYWEGGRYRPDALGEINHLLRDHRTGDVGTMAPALLDLLHRLHRVMGSHEPFAVISGYRSPKTNAALAAKSGGVATNSLHMRGMAIDIRLPGRNLRDVYTAALGLKGGGVGYYQKSNFIHMDVGAVRRW